MREKGEVTVFLAMILVMIMTLLLVMAESARTAGQRLYLRVASNSAMESLMAQYHRSLWNEYRILGLETDSKGLLEEEFKGFLEPYMEGKKLVSVENRGCSCKRHGSADRGKRQLYGAGDP